MAIFQGTGFRGQRGERRLATTRLDDGSFSVASTHRLVVLQDGQVSWERRWEDIRAATWEGEQYTLKVQPAFGEPVQLVVPDKGNLAWASVVRERIQASVITWQSAAFAGGQVRVVARHRRGRVMLDLEVPDGVDPADPRLSDLVESLRAEVAADVGEPNLRTSRPRIR